MEPNNWVWKTNFLSDVWHFWGFHLVPVSGHDPLQPRRPNTTNLAGGTLLILRTCARRPLWAGSLGRRIMHRCHFSIKKAESHWVPRRNSNFGFKKKKAKRLELRSYASWNAPRSCWREQSSAHDFANGRASCELHLMPNLFLQDPLRPFLTQLSRSELGCHEESQRDTTYPFYQPSAAAVLTTHIAGDVFWVVSGWHFSLADFQTLFAITKYLAQQWEHVHLWRVFHGCTPRPGVALGKWTCAPQTRKMPLWHRTTRRAPGDVAHG